MLPYTPRPLTSSLKKRIKMKRKENTMWHHFPGDGEFSVNLTRTWVSRYLAKHSLWVCLRQCFWMRLAFELVD